MQAKSQEVTAIGRELWVPLHQQVAGKNRKERRLNAQAKFKAWKQEVRKEKQGK